MTYISLLKLHDCVVKIRLGEDGRAKYTIFFSAGCSLHVVEKTRSDGADELN